MKKVVFVIGFTVLSLLASIAQNNLKQAKKGIPESAVPAAVLNAFKSAYPGATEVVWHKAPKREVFRVGFTTNGVRSAALYANDGKLLRTIEIGKENLLNQNMLSEIKAKAANAEIKRVEKHTLLQRNNEIRYHVIPVDKTAKMRYYFRFDGNGKLLDMKQKAFGQAKSDSNEEVIEEILQDNE